MPPPILNSAPPAKNATIFILMVSWAAKMHFLVWPLGLIANIAFRASSSSLTPLAAWTGLLAFAFQVYLLISSSSDLIAALGRLKGDESAVGKFDTSYRTLSLTEFWQRAIGSFSKLKPATWQALVLAVLAVLPVAGLGLSQIAWLIVMGLFLVIETKMLHQKALWYWLPGVLARLVTFLVLLLSWVFLRSANMDHAMHYFGALTGRWDLTETALILEARVTTDSNLLIVIASAIIVFVLPTLQSLIAPVQRWKWISAGAVAALFLMSAFSIWPNVLYRVFNRGNEQVFAGRGGWFFDARELNALTGWGALQPELSAPKKPENRAPASVLKFAKQLKERGVPLLLIPLPMKASVYPEYITGSNPESSEAPLYHQSQPALYEQLAQAGIDVQDVTQAMLQMKERKQPVFLKQDTHWTPEAMQELAKAIASLVRKKYPAAAGDSPMIIDAKARDGFSYGDLAERLNLTGLASPLTQERAVLLSFPSIENDPSSSVVLLGDDFTTVFDDPSLGFVPDDASAGKPLKAGFAQHLALYLGKALDTYATRPRATFAQRLDDDVRAKKLVIWLLPARDLLQPVSAGMDWDDVTFNTEKHPPTVITPMIQGTSKGQ